MHDSCRQHESSALESQRVCVECSFCHVPTTWPVLFALFVHITLQALERITALDRCLSVPGGAVLLYGPCGSGRRSLLQLVAHAQGLRFWSPAISRCVCVCLLVCSG